MARTRTASVAVNTGASVAMRLIHHVTAFVLKTVFIRTLGAQYNGVSALFSSILAVLALADLGFGAAVSYALYEPLREKNYARIAALMRFYQIAFRCVALFILAGGLCCIPFLPYIVKKVPDITENITLLFVLYLVESASSYLFVYKSTLLTASQKRHVISRISIVFSLIRTGVQIAVLYLFGNFLLFLLVGIAESVIRNWTVSRAADKAFPELARLSRERLSRDERKKLFRDLSALFMYRLSGAALNGTDYIVTGVTSETGGMVSVGNLNNYRTVIHIIQDMFTQFFTSLTPSLGDMAVDSDADKQYRVFRSLRFVTFWGVCFCVTCFVCLLDPFISLWLGRGVFSVDSMLMYALILDFYIAFTLNPVGTFRTSNGLFVQGKYRPLAMALLNVGLSVALARPLGIFGILIATTISRLLTQFWYDPVLIYRRVFRKSSAEYFAVYALHTLVTAVSCLVTFWLCARISAGHPLAAFAVRLALCLLIPNALVIVLFHRTEEYRMFVARISQLLRPVRAKLARKRSGR